MDKGQDGYRPDSSVAGKRRIRPCPPHGPMMVEAVERDAYVARCLRCGLSGPACEDGVGAKQVFDEAFSKGR